MPSGRMDVKNVSFWSFIFFLKRHQQKKFSTESIIDYLFFQERYGLFSLRRMSDSVRQGHPSAGVMKLVKLPKQKLSWMFL